MRPALQRLLARPSSVDYLRYIIQQPSLECPMRRSLTCSQAHCLPVWRRTNTTTAAVVHSIQGLVGDDADHSVGVESCPKGQEQERQLLECVGTMNQPREILPSPDFTEREISSTLLDHSWTSEDFELESNLDADHGTRERLVDKAGFSHDLGLWAFLMEFRMRRYGDEGVAMYWKAVQIRQLELPTEGDIATFFWTSFLDLGFRRERILREVCWYANKLFDKSGNRWSKFYVYIMQHMVLQGGREEIVPWHDRLIKRHSPGAAIFSRFVGNIVHKHGDLEALKLVCIRNKNQKIYVKIIPVLLSQGDFQNAFDWHFLLMGQEDFPSSQKIVEPLLFHYAAYDPQKAVRVAKSLVAAGVSFASKISADLKDNKRISRELMNLIHGEAFHIERKGYNDKLGARWFATSWVSLDLAISAIHALGVMAIGPLSLQAIALRQSSPTDIVRRIDQLQELGISIGNSVFSRAVDSFARANEHELLKGLLESDQHPDSLEDWKLQESLLASYARDNDLVQYRRTMALRLIGSASPRIEQHNIRLREHVTKGDRTEIHRTLEEMQMAGITITQTSIDHILRKTLQPRRQGHVPVPSRQGWLDLHTVISILMGIMKHNGFVPAKSWQELIRRLGMLGRLDDLDRLCLWLGAWYKPKSDTHALSVGLSSQSPLRLNRHLIAAQVPTSHHLHPLRMLFSDALQQAIVEWGFKHAPLQNSQRVAAKSSSMVVINYSDKATHQYTRGVYLLKLLENGGVYINVPQVKRALLNRFAILYGPGESRVVRNRVLKRQNNIPLEDMIGEVNKAWGGDLLPGSESLRQQLSVAIERGLRGQRN